MFALTSFTPVIPPALAAFDKLHPDSLPKEIAGRVVGLGFVPGNLADKLYTAITPVNTVDEKPTNAVVAKLIASDLLAPGVDHGELASAVFSVLNNKWETIDVSSLPKAPGDVNDPGDTVDEEGGEDEGEGDEGATVTVGGPNAAQVAAWANESPFLAPGPFARLRQILSIPAKVLHPDRVAVYKALKDGQQAVSALSDVAAAEAQPFLDKYAGNGKRAAYAYLLTFYLSLV